MPDLIKVAKKKEESKEKDFELFNLDDGTIFNINGEDRRKSRLYWWRAGDGS